MSARIKCSHLAARAAGYEPDGSPIYECVNCGEKWNTDESEHWSD